MSTLESSVPERLQVPRTTPTRLKRTFTPPYPSFSARFDPEVDQVVMAYLGVQYHGGEVPASVSAAVAVLDDATSADDGPGNVDRATYVDEQGFTTRLTICYWTDVDRWERWREQAVETWLSPATTDAGYFAEVLMPRMDRFETLFSNDRVEGISELASDGLSGEVVEHGYWGGMRDRMPASWGDDLAPVGEPTVVEENGRQVVRTHDNLCLIRSGQEWTETDGDERAMYLDDVEPVLSVGMDFLRDEGRSIGCYANRYMRVLDADGAQMDKTFGMSWWRSLTDLEVWAESHPTHKAIFGAAMTYLGTMGPAARLRLFHEVTVVPASCQTFTYVNCHPDTGMLGCAPTS